MRPLRALWVLLCLCFLAGCSGGLAQPGARLAWHEPEAAQRSARDPSTTDLAVAPGTVLRFVTDGPLRLAEVARGNEGEVETWRTYAPDARGVVFVRTGLETSVLRGPSEVLAKVRVGDLADPEIAWFDVEAEVLTWARSPLGTPFPGLGRAPIEATAFHGLDEALGEARTPDDSDVAVRQVVGLRALRVVQGLRGYPYAENVDVDLGPGVTRVEGERLYTSLAQGKSFTVDTSGPSELFVWARVDRGPRNVTAELRVVEGERVRSSSRATVRPARESANGESEGALLHRLTFFVPPGAHRYRLEVLGGHAFVAARTSRAVVRLGDALAGSKSETRLLAAARRSCDDERRVATCLLALALAGADDTPLYAKKIALASPRVRAEAEQLTTGRAVDPVAARENDAVLQPDENVRALGTLARDSLDPAVRDAWQRATWRETKWVVTEEEREPAWHAFVSGDPNAPACAEVARASAAASELGPQLVHLASTSQARLRVVRFLAVAPCSESAPLELEVDGTRLLAQPSGPQAELRVAVRGDAADVRRLDHSPGHLYVLSNDVCSARPARIAAPHVLTVDAPLTYATGTTAPGVDVWVREGVREAHLDVQAAGTAADSVTLVVRPASGGLVALDESGRRWLRAARAALPAAFAEGARAHGNETVAVQAIARGIEHVSRAAATEVAREPDVDAVIALSRQLRDAPTEAARASLLVTRARLLASYGEAHAALEDAEQARRLGGADTLAEIARATLPRAVHDVPDDFVPYGLDADFDPKAARCVAESEGPRARLTAVDEALRAAYAASPKSTETTARLLATRVASAVLAAPGDPRAEGVLARALHGSRWKPIVAVEGAPRGPFPLVAKDRDPLVEADGRLRPRIDAGDPFASDFATITADRPARIVLGDLSTKAMRLDIVCRTRSGPPECPLRVARGDKAALPYTLDATGRGAITLARGRGALSLTMPDGVDAYALVRVVFDVPTEGATEVPHVGYVLRTPRVRFLYSLDAKHAAHFRINAPDVVRVEAVSEDAAAASDVIVSAGGVDVTVANGTAAVIPIPHGGDVTVRSRSGAARVALSERVALVHPDPLLEAPNVSDSLARASSQGPRVTLEGGAWRDVANESPAPLGWLPARLGTLEVFGGGVTGTIRDGAPSDTAIDSYLTQAVLYRRRIESLDLQTVIGGTLRERSAGAPTYNAEVGFYEDFDALRLRLTGTLLAYSQVVDGSRETTITPRGFFEYSGRVRPDFYILPRIGFDGNFTTLKHAPTDSRNVDDDVYNAFRQHRNSFGFLQALFWYVPYFNDIFYLRTRATYDLTNGIFSHASARPGAFVIFRTLEFGAFFDASYYVATPGARISSGVDATGGLTVLVHLPAIPGSLEFRPNASAQARDDGGWQVWAGLSILSSYRRGVRDYSSLELSFPEETSYGIPWRSDRKGP